MLSHRNLRQQKSGKGKKDKKESWEGAAKAVFQKKPNQYPKMAPKPAAIREFFK